MTGVLYIVATPIGNLDDISLRAIATLKAVDLIAAEDTRHSRQLLNHLGIDTRMISCHEHNESARSVEILEQLSAGHDVALISDAGTPLISDPGYRLVHAAQQQGIRVSPIPGANSAVAALSAAGTEQKRPRKTYPGQPGQADRGHAPGGACAELNPVQPITIGYRYA